MASGPKVVSPAAPERSAGGGAPPGAALANDAAPHAGDREGCAAGTVGESSSPAAFLTNGAAGRIARFGPLVLALFLVALALPPRLLDTVRFVKTDE
jgi:hypothetical protein